MYTLIGEGSDKLYETIPQIMLYFCNVLTISNII
jgi:hypothetical protein